MPAWIPIVCWVGVLVFALIVLGLCGYEVFWKLGRLRRDAERLQALKNDLDRLQGDVAATMARGQLLAMQARPTLPPRSVIGAE